MDMYIMGLKENTEYLMFDLNIYACRLSNNLCII